MISSEQKWSTTAPTYSANIARTSAVAAKHLVEKVNNLRSIDSNATILDNGAGTGAVSLHIAANMPSTRVLAADISQSMLDTIEAAGHANVSTQIADARIISGQLGKERFTHAFNTFMLQTITDPQRALAEMRAVLQSDGVIGVAVWGKRNGPFEVWERACQSIDPSYRHADPFDDPNAWRTVAELENALSKAGMEDIKVEEITAPFPFPGASAFADFWFGAKNPAAVKCMSNWPGDPLDVRPAVERIAREDFKDGQDIMTWAVLGTGRKP